MSYIDNPTPSGVGTFQPLDDDLTAIAALAGTGLLARTGPGTWALRTLQPPAAGLTIANPGGVLGDPAFALANDLAALEAMAGTGLVARIAAETYAQRTIVAGANVSVGNGDGVAGNPTVAVSPQGAGSGLDADLLDGLDSSAFQAADADLTAIAALAGTGILVRTGAGVWALRSVAVTDTTSVDLTITNGDGVAGNPTLSAVVIPGGITHSTLAGLTTGDAGHTQFWLLAGRAGGQVGIGGTGAGDDATFQSTSHATKGDLIFDDAQQWWPSIPDLSSAGTTRVARFDSTLVMSPSSGESVLSGYYFAPVVTAAPSGVIVASTIQAVAMDVSGIAPAQSGGLAGVVVSALDVSGTMVNTTTNGIGNAILLRMRPTYQSNTANVAPFGFIQNVITARVRYNASSGTGSLTDSSCMTDLREFENVLSGGTFTIGAGGQSGVFTIASQPTFRETAGTLSIETRRGFWHREPIIVGSPAVTTDVALDVADLAVSATTNPLWVRVAGANVRGQVAGSLRLGSSTAGARGGSRLDVDGGLTFKRTTVADAAYTALTTDLIIEYTSLTANRTVTLPAAATAEAGKIYIIKKGTSAAFNVVIDGNGAETIDGAATVTITAAFGEERVYCTGSAWMTF